MKLTPSSMHCSRRSGTFIVFSVQCPCAVTAPGCSDHVVFFEILLGTCCSVTLVCASSTSRGSLFVVILLLLSDRDELGCSALFSSALSPLITTSPPMSSLLRVRVTSCVGPLLTSLVTSLVLCSGQCLWWCWVVCLMLRILRRRPKDEVSDPAVCPSQFSSEAPTWDGRRHWPSPACLSFLDPWSRVIQLHQPVHD